MCEIDFPDLITGRQDVQDTVNQPVRVTPGSADVWFRQRKVSLDDFPEFVIDFQNDPELDFI